MVESRIVWRFFDRCDFHFSDVCLKKNNAPADVYDRCLRVSGCRGGALCEEDVVICFFILFSMYTFRYYQHPTGSASMID